MKKGQSGVPQWLVLLILGVSLSVITGATYYSIFVESQKSVNSFNDLVDKINLMEDGETLDYSLYLDSSDILISFDEGQNYEGPSDIAIKYWGEDCEQGDTIKVPDSCGQYPCLCICDTSLQYDFEDSCTKHQLVCYPFIEKDLSFYDPTCTSVYKEGENNGILQLHLELNDKILSFCENKECIAEDDKEVVEGFKNFVNDYQFCLASKSTCSCDLDYSFMESGYALNFYTDKLELYNAVSKVSISSESFTTNIDSNNPEIKFTNLISLYKFELFNYQIAEFAGTTDLTYFTATTSTDKIDLMGDSDEMPTEIDTALLFKDNKLYFTSEDLSDYTSCEVDERLVL